MNTEEVQDFINKSTFNEVRQLRNFCNRVMRVKQKKAREQRENRIFRREKIKYLRNSCGI